MDELRDFNNIKPYYFLIIMLLLAAVAGVTHCFTLPEEPLMEYRLHRLAVFLFLLACVTALSMATGYYRKMLFLFPSLVLILVAGDVGYHGINYNTFMEKRLIFPQTPLTRFLSKEKVYSRTIGWKGCLLAGTEHVYEYDSITGYDPMKIYAYERILTLINGAYSPVFTLEIQSLDSEWIHFLGVKHIVTAPGVEDQFFSSDGLELVYNGTDGQVYNNKKSFLRAFWANGPIQAKDRIQAYDFISNDGFSPLTSTVVETREIIEPTFLKGSLNKPPVIEQMEGNTIKVRVENSSGLLVFSEVWFPGWEAYVDGEKKEILRVNTTFMGVLVSSNAKEVKLVFSPASFKTGCWVSLISLVICLLIIARTRVKMNR